MIAGADADAVAGSSAADTKDVVDAMQETSITIAKISAVILDFFIFLFYLSFF
jgi:hypothetical protein